MFIYLNRRGQSTLEYAVIIAVIVGALLAIQIYIKRGIQGRLKQASDDIGSQFSPGASYIDYTTNMTSSSNESTVYRPTGNMSTTTTRVSQTQNRTGTERVGRFDDADEYWGPTTNSPTP